MVLHIARLRLGGDLLLSEFKTSLFHSLEKKTFFLILNYLHSGIRKWALSSKFNVGVIRLSILFFLEYF